RRVAIVGGGLVGALAALYFGRRDWNVDLFELRKDPRIPGNQTSLSQKSINLALSTRGLSALANTGLNLDEMVLNFVIPMKGRMIHLDKAHCMVPFYGQGMNCGFQDVELLDRIFERFNITAFYNDDYDDKLEMALEEYTKLRHEDAVAICDLAMYNYIEMRSNVVNPWYLVRRKVEVELPDSRCEIDEETSDSREIEEEKLNI
ncbi:18428_t:CDS:2, partial [Racocetra fulgida]